MGADLWVPGRLQAVYKHQGNSLPLPAMQVLLLRICSCPSTGHKLPGKRFARSAESATVLALTCPNAFLAAFLESSTAKAFIIMPETLSMCRPAMGTALGGSKSSCRPGSPPHHLDSFQAARQG